MHKHYAGCATVPAYDAMLHSHVTQQIRTHGDTLGQQLSQTDKSLDDVYEGEDYKEEVEWDKVEVGDDKAREDKKIIMINSWGHYIFEEFYKLT